MPTPTPHRAHTERGFTLIELLVVMFIIGLLASTILASVRSVRAKAKDVRRLTDLRALRYALEEYNTTNNAYPSTSNSWRSQCATWGNYAPANVIPNLAPTYIPNIPADPDMNAPASTCCYLYRSNGTDYKILVHNCDATIDFMKYPEVLDPNRDGGTDACLIDGIGPWEWAIYSTGACAW